MYKKITLVTLFEQDTIDKINDLISETNEKICKIPYGIDNDNREKMDDLPFHITISAWDNEYRKMVIDILKEKHFDKIKLEVDQVKIKVHRENSFVLYLSVKDNDDMKSLRTFFYNKLPREKYNPNNTSFSITLHIDKKYERILAMKEKIESRFEPFEIEFDKLGLFEIYPAKKIINTLY